LAQDYTSVDSQSEPVPEIPTVCSLKIQPNWSLAHSTLQLPLPSILIIQ